ncbi:MAG: MupG family TIM beta-alpha barrel fold protein [Caloramator sp.]|nr:MupG family TIM beta-alpha barrel fold protein [Caloramator sp.]
MRQLGISIYPEKASFEENIKYLHLAAKYGFKRVFTCLLSVNGDKEKIVGEFKEIINEANSLNMQVVADVSPRVFNDLSISYKDLSFFNDLKVYGIRLDMGFTGLEESLMTYNPYNLKIEINMSSGTKYIDNILSYKPNLNNIIASHNFYPHRYSGLSFNHFVNCSRQFKDLGIRTAAFISSNNSSFGPWMVNEGLCTLEIHRNLPVSVQAKHLFATNLIDDVIIANCFASEEEMIELSRVNKDMLTFNIELVDNIPEIEKKIVLEEIHFNRGDVSDYMIRSTQSRVKYKGHEFTPFNTPDIKRGDILIDTSLYGHYAGELQVALKDMKNSGRTNVVGRIKEEEIFLIDYIEPWQKFGFTL